MAETESAAAPATPKKAKAAKPRKPKAPDHPKVSDMVNSAIADLNEKGGSSLQAIKKYISGNYKVDIERLSPFIRKYLRNAVVNGGLVQTKGKGASGSFRMNGSKGEKPKRAISTLRKPKAAMKKVVPKAAKKASTPKKAKKAKASPKKAKAAAKPKVVKPKKAKAKAPAKKAGRPKK